MSFVLAHPNSNIAANAIPDWRIELIPSAVHFR
jgi:hypothetical protein